MNLEAIPFEKMGEKSFKKSRTSKRVYCIDNGKYYRSTVEASKYLHITSSGISKICNGYVKNPSVRVIWAKENLR